ncbi:MAG: YtxH domain-containing protein [Bacteroides sp.]|nr:YtxH domain-containing protein [Bacteroides sp.]MCM1446937.1 YtxH domain-containing protein [Bacteroides sp.]MCM1516914.1 YtxH domain-containing protein [Paraprevotella sp.]
MKAINYLLAFIGGAAVGAAAGILFAPEKGSNTRAMIVENLKKRGIKLSKKELEDLASDIAEDLGLDNAE